MAPAQDGTSCKDRTYQGVCINGKCEVRLCSRGTGILIAWLDLLVIAKPRGPSRELKEGPRIGFI